MVVFLWNLPCRTMAAGVLPLRAINDLIEESAAVQETMERADRLDGLSEIIFVALAVWILIWVIIRFRRKGGE